MKIKSFSPEQTKEIANNLAKKLKKGLICLYGELGTGKTTFMQGFAKSLGISSKVASPTFTYSRIHKGKFKLYHFDCYRISAPDLLLIQELKEALERKDGFVAVEWAEKISEALPQKRTEIYFNYIDENTREINIKPL